MVWSNYELAKKTRKILEEDISSGKFAESIHKKLEEEKAKLKTLIAKHYPEHANHQQEEGDWHYFDAMFVSLELICSCGEVLVIRRDMV